MAPRPAADEMIWDGLLGRSSCQEARWSGLKHRRSVGCSTKRLGVLANRHRTHSVGRIGGTQEFIPLAEGPSGELVMNFAPKCWTRRRSFVTVQKASSQVNHGFWVQCGKLGHRLSRMGCGQVRAKIYDPGVPGT